MHPPEVRQPGRVQTLPRLGRSPQRLRCLADVVLEQPRLGQCAADLNLLLTAEPGPLERTHQQGRGVRATPLIEGPNCLAIEVLGRHVD